MVNWKYRDNEEEDEDEEDNQKTDRKRKKPKKTVNSKEKEYLERDKIHLKGMKGDDLKRLAEDLEVDKNLPEENIVQELTEVYS